MKLVANSTHGVMINMNNKQGFFFLQRQWREETQRERKTRASTVICMWGNDHPLKVNKLRRDRIALLFNQDACGVVSVGDLLLNCFQSELPEGKLHILAAKGQQRAKVKVLCDVFFTHSHY